MAAVIDKTATANPSNVENSQAVKDAQAAYAAAFAKGDKAGMAAAHTAAENARAAAGYSGGSNGAVYSAVNPAAQNPAASAVNLGGMENSAGVKRAQEAWAYAYAHGDKAGMAAAHQSAEQTRANGGYSGGANGATYSPTLSAVNAAQEKAAKPAGYTNDQDWTNSGHAIYSDGKGNKYYTLASYLANEYGSDEATVQKHIDDLTASGKNWDYGTVKNLVAYDNAWKNYYNELSYRADDDPYSGDYLPGWKGTYSAGTDYSRLMKIAADSGDYSAAAYFEKQRNAKIAGEGLAEKPTNDYQQYLKRMAVSGNAYNPATDYTGKYLTFLEKNYGRMDPGWTDEAVAKEMPDLHQAIKDFEAKGDYESANNLRYGQLSYTKDYQSGKYNNGSSETQWGQYNNWTQRKYDSVTTPWPQRSGMSAAYERATGQPLSYEVGANGTGGTGSGLAAGTGSGLSDLTGGAGGTDGTGAGGLSISGSGGGGLTATSQADYINSMYDANQNSALAKLKSAYDTNNQTLDATAAKIPKTYYNSENQLAASNDQQRQSFNEYAAANGLNNGAGGQAQLAYSNQYQKSYTSLEQAKADALAQVEQQRASLATKYQNDIAQAVADNDISRAQALYQEAIRVDNSVVSWAQQQATWAYQEQQTQEERAYEAQQTAATNATKQQESIAETMAGIGDYSGYKALGYSDSQINALTAAYKAAVAAKTAKSSGSGSGSKSGSGSSGYSYTPTNGWSAVDAYVSRGGDAADYIGANYKALGYKSKSQAVSAYNVYSANKAYNTKVENSTIPTTLKSGMAKNLYAMATDKTRDKSLIATRISTAYNAGAITEAEADFLLKKIGG